MPSVARSRSASARTTIAVLAAQLHRQALQALGRASRDAAAGLGVAGEADDRNVRALDDGVAHLAAGAGHEVDGPGREARLDHELHEERRAVRRVARRLEHDGVAGHEGRHHLPARDRHREVPGRDDPGHADRLADAHRPLVGKLRRGRLAEHPAPLAGHRGRRCRCPPGHRRGPPPGPCPSPGSSPARGAPCARPSGPRSGTGSRPAWVPGSVARGGRAVSAARTARATSAALPAWNVPMMSRVLAGFRLSKVRPDSESHPFARDEEAERRRLGRAGHRALGDGVRHATRSNAIATEPPPPRHSVARP